MASPRRGTILKERNPLDKPARRPRGDAGERCARRAHAAARCAASLRNLSWIGRTRPGSVEGSPELSITSSAAASRWSRGACTAMIASTCSRGRPLALHHALDLDFDRAVDDQHALQPSLPGAGLDQQRHDDDRVGTRGRLGDLAPGLLADHRVKDRLEPLAALGVGERELAHRSAIEAPVGRDHARAERSRGSPASRLRPGR